MNEGRDRQKAISPMSDEAAAMPHIPRILQTETQDRPGDLRQECGHIQRGIKEWPHSGMDKNDARAYIINKLIASFGVTYPVHISHITGIPTAEVKPFFVRLEQEGKISPVKVGKKLYYIQSSKRALLEEPERGGTGDSEEVRLISPMDILMRDQTWLKTFFDYSYTFEYFKKKGMKWPLSILVGNRFVGYFDCKMEWRTGNFMIKERNLFDSAFDAHKGIERAIEDLAAFHVRPANQNMPEGLSRMPDMPATGSPPTPAGSELKDGNESIAQAEK